MGIMKALTLKDKKNRCKDAHKCVKKIFIKALKKNSIVSLKFSSKVAISTYLPKKVRNRCVITGRGRAIIKDFKLSRLEFSKTSKIHNLPGVKKASW